MDGILMALIVVCAIIVTIIVIMQPSKDGGLGGLASGGVTGSVLGAGRNEFLAKATWWLFAIFLISSIALARHQTNEIEKKQRDIATKSVVEEESADLGDDSTIDTSDDADKKVEDVLKEVEKSADEVKEKSDDLEKDLKEKSEELKEKSEELKKDLKEEIDKATEENKDLIENIKTDGLKLDSGSDK